jgi:hypothetical protein
MITLMALSLCVGLLIDDAIVVRENIVRHVQMGKRRPRRRAGGHQEIGLAVLATTLSIVAVFLPIGFMGGIIGKFFHEFGITIVAAVLISMFVSFTLDPMLSSVWHDPACRAGHRVRAQGRFSARPASLLHAGGQQPGGITEARRARSTPSCARCPRCATPSPPSTPAMPPAATMRQCSCAWSTARTAARSVDQMSVPLRERLRQVAGITVTHVGLLEPWAGNKQISLSLQGTDRPSCSAWRAR